MQQVDKKVKIEHSSGAVLYSKIDFDKLAFEEEASSIKDAPIKMVGVKYNGARLSFQMVQAGESLKCPFGYNDGSNYKPPGKPYINIELPPDQLDFAKRLEEFAKDAAVKHASKWFKEIKPAPNEFAIRSSFASRIKEDDDQRYPPNWKVDARNVRAASAERVDGNLTEPTYGCPEDLITQQCQIIPVVQVKGGVWIRKEGNGRFTYGISITAERVIVVDGDREVGSSGFNLEGIDIVVKKEKEEEAGE